jgi:sigma-E factor negative regulatory protein RseC
VIEEQARVTQVSGKEIWVETQRKSVCGQCAANKGCGTSVLQNVLGNKRSELRVLSDISVDIGDEVIIGLQEGAFLKGSFAVYLLPLVLMFVFGLLGETLSAQLLLTDSNAASILFAALGIAIGAYWLRRYNHSIQFDERYQPVILRLANPRLQIN